MVVITGLIQFLFWASLALMAHTYLLYPFLMYCLTRRKPEHIPVFGSLQEAPRISILMSVFNEEKVLHEKLESILRSSFPVEKMHLFLGSDDSTDQTNSIASEYAVRYPWITFYPFSTRRGKPNVINQLAEEARKAYGKGPDHVLVITDANVMLAESTLWQLVRHYKDPNIAVVDANMVSTGTREAGISKAEGRYVSLEVWLKHWEGQAWGAMIGPFGGCYAIRADYYREVPANFLVDDFFIVLRALEQGGRAINDLDALCFEAATHEIRHEFRRKKRISAGNFQNLFTFRNLWWPPTKRLSFAFFSHKVLRWTGPLFMLVLWMAAGTLALQGNYFFRIVFYLLNIMGIAVPLLDYFLTAIGIHFLPFRGIRYFLLMNLALAAGWIQYKKGITTNVWQPTHRS